ncbi:XRE family transcriptional regulator [Lactococcus formosensis]|uniref:XRE family transcriptional regulator n=1 Tax=Lactococcus formosensis TaxID=1281486 RepID=UPI001F062FD7|nr:XRE family transcriptional regulator [Lactococcus formosensis]MCH1722648.1 XRE family transcriptional regulator [Lactococcus formosensis]MDG6123911.1 XRE family transcriptional regulator [Lactococcus formosensis]MDG6152638.1 XRE family transcriptional regulator [Lactococcus formosensis]MDG6173837.1 XRE family transcriptional regulator [Lactococcus formosensis]MDG6181048.1 XRE family transcriptional regulator [Lactococcus formosensis]
MRTNEEIVRILIEEKDRQGLSISELARRVDMAKSAISRYFNYTREFPLNRADDFARVLGISTDYLLGISEDDSNKLENVSPAIEKTVETMKKLDEPRQQVVLDTATSQLKEQKAVKREKQMLPFKKMQLDKINNLVPYDHNQEGFAPVIGEIAAGTPIFSEQNFEGMRPVYGKYAGRDDVFWLHVKGDSMESEIHDGSFALILLSPDIDDGAIGAVRFTDDNSATLKCVHYEYDDAGYIKRIRLEPLNPKYPIQYADESNPAEIAGRLVKVEQDY